jgi:hypothetical protein
MRNEEEEARLRLHGYFEQSLSFSFLGGSSWFGFAAGQFGLAGFLFGKSEEKLLMGVFAFLVSLFLFKANYTRGFLSRCWVLLIHSFLCFFQIPKAFDNRYRIPFAF